MAEKQWKKCECGVIVDKDEKYCPLCGPFKNTGLQLVELKVEEIKALAKQGKVWTKYHGKRKRYGLTEKLAEDNPWRALFIYCLTLCFFYYLFKNFRIILS